MRKGDESRSNIRDEVFRSALVERSAMRTMIVALSAFLACTVGPAASADDLPGHPIVGRIAAGKALILYDVSSEVKDIVQTRATAPDGTLRLERDALDALAKIGPSVPRAKSFEVRVTYFKNGDVSPVYGTPTFNGVERFAILSMSAADIRGDRDHWKEAARSSAPIPNFVTFLVTGTLPPPAS